MPIYLLKKLITAALKFCCKLQLHHLWLEIFVPKLLPCFDIFGNVSSASKWCPICSGPKNIFNRESFVNQQECRHFIVGVVTTNDVYWASLKSWQRFVTKGRIKILRNFLSSKMHLLYSLALKHSIAYLKLFLFYIFLLLGRVNNIQENNNISIYTWQSGCWWYQRTRVKIQWTTASFDLPPDGSA